MYKYKVSIILPCYNVSKYIVKCVNSIFSQNFDNYEIIIIDDGSTDNLIEICQQWKYKDNFFIYSFKNQGLSQARNEGIKVSQGEYIYFLDPDDYIENNLLSVCYNLCKKEGVDAVQFKYDSENECGEKSWNVKDINICIVNKHSMSQKYLGKRMQVSLKQPEAEPISAILPKNINFLNWKKCT